MLPRDFGTTTPLLSLAGADDDAALAAEPLAPPATTRHLDPSFAIFSDSSRALVSGDALLSRSGLARVGEVEDVPATVLAAAALPPAPRRAGRSGDSDDARGGEAEPSREALPPSALLPVAARPPARSLTLRSTSDQSSEPPLLAVAGSPGSVEGLGLREVLGSVAPYTGPVR